MLSQKIPATRPRAFSLLILSSRNSFSPQAEVLTIGLIILLKSLLAQLSRLSLKALFDLVVHCFLKFLPNFIDFRTGQFERRSSSTSLFLLTRFLDFRHELFPVSTFVGWTFKRFHLSFIMATDIHGVTYDIRRYGRAPAAINHGHTRASRAHTSGLRWILSRPFRW